MQTSGTTLTQQIESLLYTCGDGERSQVGVLLYVVYTVYHRIS